MWKRTDKRKQPDEADLSAIRDLYGALGMGFPREARRIFDGEDPEHDGPWCLRHLGRRIRCVRTADLSNRELFVVPQRWEITGAVAMRVGGRRSKKGSRITVYGQFNCRPRGTWENVRIMFQHSWTMCGGKALVFENLLDATVLRREGSPEVCGT